MHIDNKTIEHVAEIASLKLTEKEKERFIPQLKEALEFFSKLSEVNTANAEPSFHPVGIRNAMREDTEGKCISQEEALSLATFYIGHEVGHDKFTGYDLIVKANRINKIVGIIHNILEDPRIEKLMLKQFPGLEDHFNKNITKIFNKKSLLKDPVENQLGTAMIYCARNLKIPKISKEINLALKSIKDLIMDGVNAETSEKTIEYAVKIYEKIKDIMKDSPAIDNLQAEDISDAIKKKLEKDLIDENRASEIPECIDENLNEEETITEAEEGGIGEYHSIKKAVQNEIFYLAKEIREIVEKKRQQKQNESYELNTKRGKIQRNSVWKLAVNRQDVFKQRTNVKNALDIDPDSLAFYLLIDLSGSMSHNNRIFTVKKTAIALSEVLDQLSINFSIAGYTVEDKLKRILFKRFEDSYQNVKYRLETMSALNGTYTHEHIPFAVRELEKRHERKKLLLILTDADCIENKELLNERLEIAKQKEIEPICIGIQTDSVMDFECKRLIVHDLSTFPRLIMDELRQILKG